MIHCTMEDLLALKDGQGAAWARRHQAECPVCQQELEALHQRVAQLRALPPPHPPRDRWPVVRRTIDVERRRKVLARVRWATVAVAASVALLLANRGVERYGATVAQAESLETLVTRSQQLEATLREFEPEGRILSGAAAGAVVELEDRIAVIDARLARQEEEAQRDEMLDLWRRRVALMQGLVNVHVTRATYSGM